MNFDTVQQIYTSQFSMKTNRSSLFLWRFVKEFVGYLDFFWKIWVATKYCSSRKYFFLPSFHFSEVFTSFSHQSKILEHNLMIFLEYKFKHIHKITRSQIWRCDHSITMVRLDLESISSCGQEGDPWEIVCCLLKLLRLKFCQINFHWAKYYKGSLMSLRCFELHWHHTRSGTG